jgi:uncharacterized membrane protein YuzA (DUF378 family)
MAATMAATVIIRSLYNPEPPNLQDKHAMNPTLLVSWWCTGFALAAIFIRVGGRYVRTEKLFREDWIMFTNIFPLVIRMGLVHVILIWGTNNTKTAGLTPIEIHHRSIGSRLVLASRIFYALFIWMAKWSILEFLKRLVGAFWHKSYEIGLQIIRYFLLATFIAVIISDLAECQPFTHYWQVIPDPGPHCREGIAQLMTMGICDIITDISIVAFPIPIVIRSEMALKRKISLVLLFALSLGLVGLTAYRVPATISRKSSQQFRSLFASFEILAAAGVTNAIVIGSFIRDRGVKKAKFKRGSDADGSMLAPAQTRRATITQHHWGSDEDLVRDLGMSLHPTLQHRHTNMTVPMSAPVAMPNHNASAPSNRDDERLAVDTNWNFSNAAKAVDRSEKGSLSSTSSDRKHADLRPQVSAEPVSPSVTETPASRKPSFFDVGGLLEHSSPSSQPSAEPLLDSRRSSMHEYVKSSRPTPPAQQGSRAFISDVGGLLSTHREEGDLDRSTALPPAARRGTSPHTAQSRPVRNFSRGSSAYNGRSSVAEHAEPHPVYRPGIDVGPSMSGTEDGGASSMDFVDAGGLLK